MNHKLSIDAFMLVLRFLIVRLMVKMIIDIVIGILSCLGTINNQENEAWGLDYVWNDLLHETNERRNSEISPLG